MYTVSHGPLKSAERLARTRPAPPPPPPTPPMRASVRGVVSNGLDGVAAAGVMADEEPTSPGRKRKSRERRRGSRLQSDYMVD